MFSITTSLVRVLAGQVGFRRLRITDGNVIQCLVSSRGQMITQQVGQVSDVQRLIDFCQDESIEIRDDRTPHLPSWAEDPWAAYGA